MSNDFLNPGSLWVGGEPERGAILTPWSTIDPVQVRFAMVFEKIGLGIIVPDKFISHMELCPITDDDLKSAYIGTDWCGPLPNVSKLRSIIRKQKEHAIEARRK